jgi:hypothetical protein
VSAYLINLIAVDGSIVEGRLFECASDDDAIDHAGWIDYAQELQVWQGERLVARFPPMSVIAPALAPRPRGTCGQHRG